MPFDPAIRQFYCENGAALVKGFFKAEDLDFARSSGLAELAAELLSSQRVHTPQQSRQSDPARTAAFQLPLPRCERRLCPARSLSVG